MVDRNKILLVDDNEALCTTTKAILELENYDVSVAFDGFEALELAREKTFDVVLMDIKMPVMDGVETFKRFKKIAPGTPVIMVTGYAVEALIQEALREGAFGALQKPLDFELFYATIETALSKGGLVMVVDDERDLCSSMKEILEDRGYGVRVAYDGDSAIEKARTNNFDVIILDMNLPTKNGLETYLALREMRPEVAVILITGYLDKMGGLAKQAMERNAHVCLEKPLDMERFIPMVNEIVTRKRGGILEKARL